MLLSLQELRRNLFVIKKSSKQNLNKEITRHKDSISKLDEAMKTIERLKSVIQVSNCVIFLVYLAECLSKSHSTSLGKIVSFCINLIPF